MRHSPVEIYERVDELVQQLNGRMTADQICPCHFAYRLSVAGFSPSISHVVAPGRFFRVNVLRTRSFHHVIQARSEFPHDLCIVGVAGNLYRAFNVSVGRALPILVGQSLLRSVPLLIRRPSLRFTETSLAMRRLALSWRCQASSNRPPNHPSVACASRTSRHADMRPRPCCRQRGPRAISTSSVGYAVVSAAQSRNEDRKP